MILVALAATLFAAAIFAFGEVVLRDLHHHDLEDLAKSRGELKKLAEINREHEPAAAAAGGSKYAAVAVAAALFFGRYGTPLDSESWPSFAATCIVFAVLAIAATRWGPQAATAFPTEQFVLSTWPFWRVVQIAAMPLAVPGDALEWLVVRLAGASIETPQEEFEDEILTIVADARQVGLIEDEAGDMIEGVFDLAETDVSQIMTPRTDVVMLSIDVSWSEVLAVVSAAGHSRIPIYEENRDDVVGLLHVKDILQLAFTNPGAEFRLADVMREPFFVPETQPLDDLLREFRQLRRHLAVVLDEYGGVSGLVTFEDVLEEIVGEIEDEHDPDTIDEFEIISPREAEVSARVHVDDLNERLELQLPEGDEYETIGGYVLSELRRIPMVGESMAAPHCKITVAAGTRRALGRLRIEKLDDQSANGDFS